MIQTHNNTVTTHNPTGPAFNQPDARTHRLLRTQDMSSAPSHAYIRSPTPSSSPPPAPAAPPAAAPSGRYGRCRNAAEVKAADDILLVGPCLPGVKGGNCVDGLVGLASSRSTV